MSEECEFMKFTEEDIKTIVSYLSIDATNNIELITKMIRFGTYIKKIKK